MLKDSQERAQATDPRRSFIVQAPAGSGKTEILTQRYLRLLGTVTAPEQIVALTFTRKAASEMRERILLALQQVARKEKAVSAHQQQTHDYAAEALNRSKNLDWQLLEQPGRLRVITIDALCQTLSQAIPLQEKQVPYANITDKPQVHYEAAARACLHYALGEQGLHQELKCLLEHLDNRQDNLLSLLSELLANRDQWLSSLYSARGQDKASYESMLAFIEEHELGRFQQTIPLAQREELCSLARQVSCIESNPDSARYQLRDWQHFENLDSGIAEGLAALLLTSEGKLRKGFDHHVGLKRGNCDNRLYDSLKAASKELLLQLDANPDFLEALLRVRSLPAPTYDNEQWQVLQALFTLLPILVGHLQLLFSEHNEVDFSAISQQALSALGDEEEPTDLALYLDNSIHHLLVDEFQDTSIQQYQLLAKLVQGWLPDDGRTLFVVGDPMQSIYRFRQAEVGLFLKAKEEGIGCVQLNSLELCCNFRSTETIVNWVNQQFKTIFPAQDDMESGAISFHPSDNVLKTEGDSYVKAWQFADRQLEAKALIHFVIEELARNPQDQIAILVRSRSQLIMIMRLLREQQIPFQGVEIELLSKLPHLRDIWSLTQALLMPANRLAWLSLLRSPFCGLSLADLYQLANYNKKQSIYSALSQLEKIEGLTEEGYLRLTFIYTVMSNALASRHQLRLVEWIAQTLHELQADKILNETQEADLEQYWLLLERFSDADKLPDLDRFKKEFDKLYSQRINPSRLQIMTIHKSKGLEFDSVILPGLSAKSSNRDKPLLRWLKLPSQDHDELLLVSPLKAVHRDHCLLYDYLGKLDAEKEAYELQRLLYVAATRAKKRLCLFDSTEKEPRGSFRSLLKNQEFISEDMLSDEEEEKQINQSLGRLAASAYLIPPPATTYPNAPFALSSTKNSARELGIVAHELLQWICDHHPDNTQTLPWAMVVNQLRSLGFTQEEEKQALFLLQEQINILFQSTIGQWLCKAHSEEKNEYQLLVNEQGQLTTRIIDRTFVEKGLRWIIDFKTGSEDSEAQKKHRQQVNDYARLLGINSPMPIHCGLYYLASGHWVQWIYKPILNEVACT